MGEVEWPVIGIDLGTTCSCVAVWGNNGVEIIPNELGSRTTPSYVSFTEYDRYIGEAAVNQATMNPRNTIFDAKRLIGRQFSDKSVQLDNEMRPYKVINGSDSCETDQLKLGNNVRQCEVINGTDSRGTDQPMFDNEMQPCKVIHGAASRNRDQLLIPVNYMGEAKKFTPEEITAMTLAKMKGVAEAFLGKTVKSAVISVPAFFNDSQRRATRDAGIIAGFEWIRIINEPTAVALAYYDLEMKMNRGKRGGKKVLVFDLGGGTLDVSLVEVEKGKITVKAVSGDTNLGGADFDNKMVREFVTRFKQENGKDIMENPRALGRLRIASEKAKKVLSLLPQEDVQIDYLFEGIDFSSTITRARFEELNMDLFKKCINTVWNCLNDARVNKRDVDDIVLVGGSTRIPKVQQMLQDFFDRKELCKRVHADEAVAYGAAMHAFYTSTGNSMSKEIILSDVTPISLGAELHSGKMSIAVPRNTFISSKHPETYTLCDDRNDFKFGVYEGENALIKNNKRLGECEFAGVHLPKDAQIRTWFNVDEDGLLDVFTEITMHRKLLSRTKMNHEGRLTRNEIERMVDEARHYKAKDEMRRRLLQSKSALESYVNTVSDRLGDARNVDKDVWETQKKALDSALDLLEQNSEPSDISALDLLEQNTELSDISAFEDMLSRLMTTFGDSENNVIKSTTSTRFTP